MMSENEMAESGTVTIRQHDRIVLVTVECERMEDKHARALQTEVAQAAEEIPNLPVVLDMSRVTMLPSMSIGAVVTLWQQFKQDNRRFILVGLHDEIRRTLTICRLDKLFEICETVDAALLRISGRSA